MHVTWTGCGEGMPKHFVITGLDVERQAQSRACACSPHMCRTGYAGQIVMCEVIK